MSANLLSMPVWPPYSPDLNPIEIVWAIMVEMMEKKKQKSIAELVKFTAEIRNALPQDIINALIDSVPVRIQK